MTTSSPPPPLSDTIGLKPGDVVLVARELKDKATGQPFWWRSFRAVLAVSTVKHMTVLTLKMHPDPEKDVWEIDFRDDVRQVVTKLEPCDWPIGVVSMRLKAIHQGHIKLGGD